MCDQDMDLWCNQHPQDRVKPSNPIPQNVETLPPPHTQLSPKYGTCDILEDLLCVEIEHEGWILVHVFLQLVNIPQYLVNFWPLAVPNFPMY